jgi:hypothetical protein
MVAVLIVGFIANVMIHPVDARFHESEHRETQLEEASDATTYEGESQGASPLLILAWIVVGIPLAYGVYETLVKAIDLVG